MNGRATPFDGRTLRRGSPDARVCSERGMEKTSGLLKRFAVTFDYSRQIMYLERLVPPPADAGQFDRSGLWINADDGGYRVTYVVAGSPAAEGGVATGDLI
jgi:hypothetical protein